MSEKRTARIENWYTQRTSSGKIRLIGEVYGHPYQPDGKHVMTSSIVKLSTKTVETENTIYTLGKQNEEFDG